MIQAHSGIILDYNTDAINCIFPDNTFPFELVEDIQLNGHYWDKSNKEYKYKIEYNKERLKISKMQQTNRTNIFKDMKYYNWRLTYDVEDNDFKPLVDKIMKSNQSYFITGPGGSGKTSLLKQIQSISWVSFRWGYLSPVPGKKNPLSQWAAGCRGCPSGVQFYVDWSNRTHLFITPRTFVDENQEIATQDWAIVGS